MTAVSAHPPRERPISRRRFVRAAFGLGVLAAGCSPLESPRLLTSWPLADLGILPAEWLAHSWTQPSAPFTPLSAAGVAPRLLIGGNPESSDLVSPTLTRRHSAHVGLWFDPAVLAPAEVPTQLDPLADPRWRDRIALDDPQIDRGALLAIHDHLNSPAHSDWSGRYATVLHAYANSRPPAIGRSSAAYRLRRKEVVLTLSACPSWRPVTTRLARFQPLATNLAWSETSVVANAADNAAIDAWNRLEANRAGLAPPAPDAPDPLADPALPWLADLFQAVCVSAHGELRQAVDAIAASRPTRPADAGQAAYWLDQPPPWPPASIAQLRDRRDGDRLVDLLISQIVHQPSARSWLAESWGGPRAPINRSTLVSLAAAAGGTLAREPHFRTWLRAEWSAWSRQRYRRAARIAQGQAPTARRPS